MELVLRLKREKFKQRPTMSSRVLEHFPLATTNTNGHLIREAALGAFAAARTIVRFSFLPLICNLGDFAFVTSLPDLFVCTKRCINKQPR